MSLEVTCGFSHWQVDLVAVRINGAWSAFELTLAINICIQLAVVDIHS